MEQKILVLQVHELYILTRSERFDSDEWIVMIAKGRNERVVMEFTE